MKDPRELSHRRLVSFARDVQCAMFLDHSANGLPVWNLDKELSRAYFVATMMLILREYELTPNGREAL